jgi:hypothetical protein
VFIVENYFALQSFAAIRETFNNACPVKRVPNELKYTDKNHSTRSKYPVHCTLLDFSTIAVVTDQ